MFSDSHVCFRHGQTTVEKNILGQTSLFTDISE